MNIGIDLDGVILDTENWFRTMSHFFDVEIDGKGEVDKTKVKVQERMQWNNGEFERFFDKYMIEALEQAPLKPCAKKVIDALLKKGHRLILITARGSFKDIEIELAKKTLTKNNIKFEKEYYRAYDKLKCCLAEKIDFMIDDSLNNVKLLSENGVKCLYFREFGSMDIVNENVIDVVNWGEIYRKFCQLGVL